MTNALSWGERTRRVYLVAWLVLLAVGVGAAGGLLATSLRRPPAPALAGGLVIKAGTVPAPDFRLRDQNGELVSPSSLKGRVVALTFLDTQCRQMCPLQASLLGAVQSDLGGKAPVVVVVSIRPGAETPADIDAYASGHGLVGELHWLTGSQEQLAPVWEKFDVAVQVAAGDIQHTAVIYLLDRSGYERIAFLDLPDQADVEGDVRLLEGGG